MSKKTAMSVAFVAAAMVVAFLASPVAGAPSWSEPPAMSGGNRGEYGMGLIPSVPDPSLKLDPGRFSAGLPLSGSVDLTADLPPIGDQGNQGSCVGWATGYYYKTWWEKQEHPGWNLADQRYVFSPSFVYNQINGGQDGGAIFEDAFALLEETGDVDIREFPYNDSDYSSQPSSSQKEASKQYRIPGEPKWGYLFKNDVTWGGLGPFENDISGVKNLLNSGRPLVFGIPIFDDFPGFNGNPSNHFYDYDEYDPDYQYQGGHAVYIAGYDDDAGGGRGGFLMVNSWGSGWNGNGKVYLSYDFARRWVWEAWYMEDEESSPVISTISPTTVAPGGTLTINGNNFGGNRRSARVEFAGSSQSGTVSSWTNYRIQIGVPGDASTGEVRVCDWDQERSNGKTVTVDPDAPPSPSPTPQPVPIEDIGASWLLAEGATWPGFDEWVLVMNPTSWTADVSIVFMTPGGPIGGPSIDLPAQSRVSVHVNEYAPNADVATAVTSTNGVEICAERAMYVSTPDGKWGCHDSVAFQGTSDTWYLAEGATWPGFDEWVLIMNPNSSAVDVEVSFHTTTGVVAGPYLNLAPGTRSTVHVNEIAPDRDVSTQVSCLTEGLGVVAERSMYIRTTDGRVGCHNSMGLTEESYGWGLAEGATWPGFEEWVLVQNPSGVAVNVQLFFMTPEEFIPGPVRSVPPGGRISVRVNDYAPDRDVSTMVFTEFEDQQVVVERAMYMNAPDGKLGAHNAPASAYASTKWYLPEGCTSGGFEEWVLVFNPDMFYWVYVELTFMTPAGPVAGPVAVMPPLTRTSFRVNDYVTGDVATLVESDCYVVCERSVYADRVPGKAGSHCSVGILPWLSEGVGRGCMAGGLPLFGSALESPVTGE